MPRRSLDRGLPSDHAQRFVSLKGWGDGPFAERVVDQDALSSAVTAAIAQGVSATPAQVATHSSAIRTAAAGTVRFHGERVAAALLIAGVLLLVAVVLSLQADAFAADQATKTAASTTYKAATSTLPALVTAVETLLTAWSGALLAALITDAAKT